ncbi:MAG: DUF2807 domain-containing protein [Candidatus Pedobacter colombiensis]|uniref:DUF2807 domain-containing protein n=1 Tax=Candidatus Pedobacter colombiensis TaxID=3121371 RepID=A0AAJ6B7J8_9SPHI|nr:DUF2807 domain-containing protein [Pedobacter sp.]WEK21182.1 MAG: DUF2807 domain-containing protein [Pedobacter sp.]
MKTLTLSTLIIILFASCSKERITANGDKITEVRTLGQFIGVNTNGTNTIHINYGTEFKVELSGSNNLLPYFKTNVMSSTLYLGYEKANVQHDDVEVYITLPVIKKVAIGGASHVNIEGPFLTTDYFRSSISGTGEVIIKDLFESDEVSIDISGDGKADLQKINCKKAEIEISGKGEASVKVKDKLKASISGSGKIYYIGDPEVDASISGSGKVIKF